MAQSAYLNRDVKWSSRSPSERLFFPSTRAVYLVFADDVLLYVGATENLRRRWFGHHRIPSFRNAKYTRIAWGNVGNNTETRQAEKWLIQQGNPALNGQIDAESGCLRSIKILSETHYQLKIMAAENGKTILQLMDDLVGVLGPRKPTNGSKEHK